MRRRAEHFNPRSREGSDEAAELRREEDAISIHAPVKGATLTDPAFVRLSKFQSTLP